MNSAGAQRRDLPGSHSRCQNSECQQKPEQGHPERKFLLNHAPPRAFYLLWPSIFISLSPGFCCSFQNPVTQGYCHIELELTTLPLGGSQALWVEAPGLFDILFLFPSQRFQPLGGLTLTKVSGLLKRAFILSSSLLLILVVVSMGPAPSVVLYVPASFTARHFWVKTLSLVSGLPALHRGRAWRLSEC